MERRIDRVTDLYDRAIRTVASSPEKWMEFLQSACRNYRLPFDEQILVYWQRPDATAVLEMKQWNEKFGRWVKKDSKGIAVFDKSAGTMCLKYYFDVSDTKEGRYRRLVRPVPLWEVEGRHREAVRETLANAFGVAGDVADLEKTIQEAAGNAAEDNLADYMRDILAVRKDSFLEGLDDYSVELAARELLANSTAYMVMTRCGIDPELYLDAGDFQGITDFNTPQLINLFGTAASDVSEMVLSQVADTVKKLKRQEKRNNRTFAGSETADYNHGITDGERGFPHGGNQIQQAGGLLPAGHYRAGRGGATPWEVRISAPELPSEREVRAVYHPADAGETERTPESSTGRGTAENGISDRTNGGETGRDRGTESVQPDGMGGTDEQYPPVSGGSGFGGTGLQLAEPDEGGQKIISGQEKAGDKEPPAFSVGSEKLSILERETDILDEVLDQLKIDDITFAYENNMFIAEDESHRWHGAEFYRFLADEVFVYGDDGTVTGLSGETFADFKALAAQYDVEAVPETDRATEQDAKKSAGREWYDRTHEDKSLPFFSGDDTINSLLLSTPHLKATKEEIRSFYETHEDREERTEYIKGIFNDDFTEVTLEDGRRVGYKTFQNVLQMWEGKYLSRTSQGFYDWRVIAAHFEGMRLLGKLRDKAQPILSVGGQMTFLDEMAEEKPPAFSFTQEIVDHALTRGSNVQHGKYRIYSYFLQGHTTKEKVDFLKKEYGMGGSSSIQAGTGIGEDHSAKGIRLHRGYGEKEPKMLLKWNQVAKRIDELIAAGRYMSKRELAYLPEYEKHILSTEIYHFYYNQPEEAMRPYPYGAEYSEAVELIRPQLDNPGRVEEITKSMEEVLENTADFARNFQSMQKAYKDLSDFRDGTFSLFTPLPAEKKISKPSLPGAFPPQGEQGKEPEETAEKKQIPEKEQPPEPGQKDLAARINDIYKDIDLRSYEINREGKTEQEVIGQIEKQLGNTDEAAAILSFLTTVQAATDRDTDDYRELEKVIGRVRELPAMNPPYDLKVDTIVAIGIKDYTIDFLSDSTAVLRDREFPLFTEEMTRDELERKVRENPANDHLRIKTVLTGPETTAGQSNAEPGGQTKDSTGQERKLSEGGIQADGNMSGNAGGEQEKKEEASENVIPIGTEFMLDGRRFAIDSINNESGMASLRDITFQESSGFPIFRSEPIERVRGLIENQREEKESGAIASLTPAWEREKPKRGRLKGFGLHPEIPLEERNQYHISNDELGHGTQKEKFRANLAAIQLLKKCEAEDRLATPEEQEILSKYVGWGGLSDAFDETKSAWGTEYLELKAVLTEEEYAAARQSTLTAFYTPPVVIRAMYQVLENMGLESGNILEPSCATGNFIGMKPESLSDCKIYGVEIDPISGRIAGQLYQKSEIAVQGFEEAELPDSFFDVAVGNVPFGQFKVSDKRYDRHNFLIHDYFFAKTLDKVRPGGVIAFITSSGTMDKKNPAIRKYIAQRAELLGAVRLPNDTFKKNAGTEVTADILFLQKRDRLMETEPEWLYLDVDKNGITQNRYFVTHPDMVLGEMAEVPSQFGMDSTCVPYEDKELAELLKEAVQNIEAEIGGYEAEELAEEEDNTIPADPSVHNFSFTLWEGKIYYRENSRMKPVELSVTGTNRVKGMVAIRDCVRELIDYQMEGYPDEKIREQQEKLNNLYDVFRSKYGLLNARANSMVFSDDNSYPLLSSLEILAEDGTLERKADMFTKRTIKPHETVARVDTASEALSLSLSEKTCVDMEYMCSLTGKTAEELERELAGVIFREPGTEGKNLRFVAEDEYLSGNVREKLRVAKLAAEADSKYKGNVEALERVQPKDLTASEISVRLGTTWIPADDIEDFMYGLLETPFYARRDIRVRFSAHTGEWQVEGKSSDKGNVKAYNAYGTHKANAYRIIEDSLNLRDTRIYDYVEDENGKKKAILNKKETAIAQGKQDLIKQAFQDWIWKEPERRQRLTDYYNGHFNTIRPREYDGSHLKFYGMNPEIKLRQHQKNGAARIIYGGNSLLAYVVGAGKTYTMVAAAMEMKRLGLCNKSMVVVPNHIIEQFAAEWLQLYPAANILVATKKDFETKNRRRFCARIATSEIDAVIIGHSQFEKIPLSVERQQMLLRKQIEEVVAGIREMKGRQGSRFTVKQLEKSKKSLEARLKKLNDQSRKDDVVTFEELGVDRLFVDEADNYKNLYLYTKMRNVGGIAQTEALKSSDMFMKCQYLDELTGGKGVIFATGTPVSNSMVELYTMQRYLQYNTLVQNNLQHFDAWASTFGETVTAIELAPEGTGYRLKTRFAKFYNLPELMMMFREVADIQTADMLNLPVPEAEYRVVKVKPSEMQKEMVAELGKRAELIREGNVPPNEDNMLLITNDGRKLALDQRLVNEMLPDEPGGKINACVEEVYQFWQEGKGERLTQLVFCDLSTPKTDGTFSVYNDVRDKLIAKGVPPEEIEFIHNANTDTRKKELFSKVRRGAVRILIGSTFKMGAGTNVQDRIIASHDLDCPWRPRDLEQRAGRTVRQGNRNKKVDIIRYVTEGTFDAYLYQIIENKQKFISQIMTSKSPARTVEDIDEVALSYAEIKALAAGNPYVKEKMDLDVQVSKLQLLKQSFLSQKYEMEDKVTKAFPREIKKQEELIAAYEKDIAQVKAHTPPERDVFPPMQIDGETYTEKKEAGKALIAACNHLKSPDEVPVGAYRGLEMGLFYDAFSKEFVITLHGERAHRVPLGTDIFGNITRIDNEIDKFSDNLERCRARLENTKAQLETAKTEAKKEFPKEQELREKTARLGELNSLLDMDKVDKVILDEEPDGTEVMEPAKKREDRER